MSGTGSLVVILSSRFAPFTEMRLPGNRYEISRNMPELQNRKCICKVTETKGDNAAFAAIQESTDLRPLRCAICKREYKQIVKNLQKNLEIHGLPQARVFKSGPFRCNAASGFLSSVIDVIILVDAAKPQGIHTATSSTEAVASALRRAKVFEEEIATLEPGSEEVGRLFGVIYFSRDPQIPLMLNVRVINIDASASRWGWVSHFLPRYGCYWASP